MQAALIAACTVFVLVLGVVLFQERGRSTDQRPAVAATTAAPEPTAPSSSPTEQAAAAAPAHLRIPAIGVDAEIAPMGLEDDGALEVPDSAESVGWWSGGEAPSEDGPTVLVGHRDSREGPAVFYDVPDLAKGTEIVVEDANRKKFTFEVERVELHKRNDFPTDAVYGSTNRPTLRLLTCGGAYDPDRGYEDNYVVFAVLDT